MFEGGPDIVGVDFSGAEKAGQNIWVAECSESEDVLTVHECYAAESKTETDERASVLEWLCDAILHAGSCVVGLDFPFGIPREVTEIDGWEEFIRGFETEYETPEQFSEDCKSAARKSSGGTNSNLRRETEQGKIGGLCSYGLRIQKQTYYGIRDVLAKLFDADVSIRPMQESDTVNVVETYPAATLGEIGAERTGYKQQRQEAHDIRRENLEVLEASGLGFSEERPELRDYALCDDNALDALVCAFAASRAKRANFEPEDERYHSTEGYIYV